MYVKIRRAVPASTRAFTLTQARGATPDELARGGLTP